MKLLFDSQLPPALARHLSGMGVTSVHVRDVSLENATDLEIWEYAKLHDFTIVSKDEDFRRLANAKGSPPQVIWIRLGNCRRVEVIAAFDQRWTSIQGMLIAGIPVVEFH